MVRKQRHKDRRDRTTDDGIESQIPSSNASMNKHFDRCRPGATDHHPNVHPRRHPIRQSTLLLLLHLGHTTLFDLKELVET